VVLFRYACFRWLQSSPGRRIPCMETRSTAASAWRHRFEHWSWAEALSCEGALEPHSSCCVLVGLLQEALVCLNDGFLSRKNEEQQQPPQQAPQGGNAPSYGNGSYSQGGQSERQHSSVGGSWGQPQAGADRPAPYQDNPSGGYNGSSGGYNGPPGGYNAPSGGGYNGPSAGGYNGPSSGGYNGPSGGASGGYGGGSSYGQNGGNAGGYGSGPQGGYGQNAPQQQQQPQASGFNSWASSSAPGLASKSASAGVWSSSGYQKKDATTLRRGGTTAPRFWWGTRLTFPSPRVDLVAATLERRQGSAGLTAARTTRTLFEALSLATRTTPMPWEVVREAASADTTQAALHLTSITRIECSPAAPTASAAWVSQ